MEIEKITREYQLINWPTKDEFSIKSPFILEIDDKLESVEVDIIWNKNVLHLKDLITLRYLGY